ncbi:MAG: B12-binding domain-containing radical SAM protein [Myxococcales bacterium]|nr:B12-binding domain-containing radical SAM protein [Myxococcales bacterium]
MKTDILLANTYFLNRDGTELRNMRPYAPLGILYLAAYVRQQGFSTQVFDCTFRRDEQAFFQALERSGARIVGFHSMFICRPSAERLIKGAKERGCTVICGGPDATVAPDMYLKTYGADYVAVGEGELTIVDLLGHLTGKTETPLKSIQGLAYLDPKGEVTQTASRPLMRDLDRLPEPARDLVDLGEYLHAWKKHHGFTSLHLITSRGCPFACAWCSRAVFGRNYRLRDPDLVAQEIKHIKEDWRPDHIRISDDIFGVNKEWIGRWRKAMQSRDAIIPFECLSRVDLLQPELLDHLKAAGCGRIWCGVESGSQKVLDAMNKNITVEECYRASQLMKERGIHRAFYIMLGYPGEKREDIHLTKKMLLDNLPEVVSISVAHPIRGTFFYDAVEAFLGREREDWKETSENTLMHPAEFSGPFYKRMVSYLTTLVAFRQRPLSDPRNLRDVPKLAILKALTWWHGRRSEGKDPRLAKVLTVATQAGAKRAANAEAKLHRVA